MSVSLYKSNAIKSEKLTIEENNKIERRDKSLNYLATLPVIHKKDEAETFLKGLRKLGNLSGDQREKLTKALGKVSLSDFRNEKGESITPDAFKAIETEVGDKGVAFALAYTAKSLQAMNDAILGLPNNGFFRVASGSQKAFHTETGGTDINRAYLDVAVNTNSNALEDIDSGYLQAFRVINARGMAGIKLSQMLGMSIFQQLHDEEVPKMKGTSKFSDEAMLGRDLFGCAFRLKEYESRFSMYTANTFLSDARVASLRTRAIYGYRHLLEQKNTFSVKPEYNSENCGCDERLVPFLNMAHALNQAYLQLMKKAGNLSYTPTDTKGKKQNPGLAGVFGQRVLVYYNPVHEEYISRLRGLGAGDDNINERIFYPFVFIPSWQVPISGAYKCVEGSEGKRDDNTGIFGTWHEAGSAKSVGVTMVLPGGYNLWPIYEDLTFASDREVALRATCYYGWEQYKAFVDDCQTMHVTLKSGSAK